MARPVHSTLSVFPSGAPVVVVVVLLQLLPLVSCQTSASTIYPSDCYASSQPGSSSSNQVCANTSNLTLALCESACYQCLAHITRTCSYTRFSATVVNSGYTVQGSCNCYLPWWAWLLIALALVAVLSCCGIGIFLVFRHTRAPKEDAESDGYEPQSGASQRREQADDDEEEEDEEEEEDDNNDDHHNNRH